MRSHKGFGAAAILALTVGAGLAGAGSAQAATQPVTQITIVPTPIAPAGTLAPQTIRTITVTAYDVVGQPVGGAPLWLAFQPTTNGGSATVGTAGLGKTLQSFSTNLHGKVLVTFTAGTASGGRDALLVQDAQTSPTIKGSDSYIYSSITAATWSPKPIAPKGSLANSQGVGLTLTVLGPGGTPATNTDVLLVFHGAGRAMVGTVVLSGHPTTVVTDGSGQVTVNYVASSAPGSTDKVTAEDASRYPSVISTDLYQY
jgi:hypothetical protein